MILKNARHERFAQEPAERYSSTNVFDGVRYMPEASAARYKARLRKIMASRRSPAKSASGRTDSNS